MILPVSTNSWWLHFGHSFNSCITSLLILSSSILLRLSFLCPFFLPIFSPVFFAKLGIAFFLLIGVWLVGIPALVPSRFWIPFNRSISLFKFSFSFFKATFSISFFVTICSNLLCSSSAIVALNKRNLYSLVNLSLLITNFSYSLYKDFS